uniref:Uncharacterized protein n=1 Tax=Cucumis melo TaxID=3656 RepID=A0A9I9DPR2_CUCME
MAEEENGTMGKNHLRFTIWQRQFYIYLYASGPDLETANLGSGLGPELPEVEPSTYFTFRLEL